MRATIVPMLALLALAGCAGSYEPKPLTTKQMAALDKALDGKVPGEKVSCINSQPQTSLRVISDSVLLYRVSSKLVYRNDLLGSCTGLSRGDTLVVRTFGSQYCRGDIAHAVDLTVGTLSGGCALGDFTPYRTPPK
jgi:hypothetical protein